MLESNSQTLSVDGGEIFYVTVGKSDTPIVVLHGGLGLDHTYLRPWFDQLSDLGQVVYPDHRGNGRSSRPDDFTTITMDSMVDDVDALRQHLGVEKIILIGHSWGGFMAQAYAAKYNDHLSGLALLNTVPVFDYQPALSGTEEQMAAFGALFSGAVDDDAQMQKLWNTILPMYFNKVDMALFEKMDAATTYSAAAWLNAGGLLANFNMMETLPKVSAPTIAITGAHDVVTPSEPGAERIASIMPNARAVTFAESAHYPFIEEETAFFVTLREWMNSL